jgi:hypothetical protein
VSIRSNSGRGRVTQTPARCGQKRHAAILSKYISGLTENGRYLQFSNLVAENHSGCELARLANLGGRTHDAVAIPIYDNDLSPFVRSAHFIGVHTKGLNESLRFKVKMVLSHPSKGLI